MTDRVVISRKQFAHLTELEANYWRNPTSETFRAVDAYQDEIGWPWKATQEQVEYWISLAAQDIADYLDELREDDRR